MPVTVGNSVWVRQQQQQGFMAETLQPGSSTFCRRENSLEHQSAAHVSGLFKHTSLTSTTAFFHISSPPGFHFKGLWCAVYALPLF